MPQGPITIFDKSTLQSLNLDEACWFETFYSANITPLFFVETLADLKKEVEKGRTPEQVVGNIAQKTPPSGKANINHLTLAFGDLIGFKVEMRGVPILDRGQPVTAGNQKGMIFKHSPEMQALQRWGDGDFLEVEYKFAGQWRQKLINLNLDNANKWLMFLIDARVKPRNFEETKAIIHGLVNSERHGFQCLRAACNFLDVPLPFRPKIIERWKRMGQPALSKFAPYAAHALEVDLFFYLALRSSLISKDRPSNKVDIAYLYYLPFCMVFVSNDHLHKKTVPLFLNENQIFVPGDQLKADLKRLDAYYSQLPEEIRERGVMCFAHNPPLEGEYLTSKIWDKFMNWRQNAHLKQERSSVEDAKLLAYLKKMTESAKPLPKTMSLPAEETDYMVIEHNIPVRMGKWRMLPREVEEAEGN